MKTFIYFSQGEWRTFWLDYQSEIAELKAKSLPVGNPEICPQNVSAVEDGKIYEWPGTVEVQISKYEGDNDLAILKLPA